MSFFDSAKHAVHQAFKETVEAVTTVSNVSQFREKGVLTPDEFVAAGSFPPGHPWPQPLLAEKARPRVASGYVDVLATDPAVVFGVGSEGAPECGHSSWTRRGVAHFPRSEHHLRVP